MSTPVVLSNTTSAAAPRRAWLNDASFALAQFGISLAVLISGILCFFIGSSNTTLLALQLAALTVGAFLFFRDSRRRNGSWAGLQSLLLCVLAIISILIPGRQLLAGQRVSRLTLLGVAGVDPAAELPKAYAVIVIAIAVFCLGECMAARSERATRPAHGGTIWRSPQLFLALLIVGGLFSLLTEATSQAGLTQRGQIQGQGLLVALTQCLPIGVTMGVLRRHWGSRMYALLSTVGLLVLLASTSSRSPVLVPLIAVIIRITEKQQRLSRVGRLVAPGLLVLYLVTVFVVSFSEYRTSTLRGEGLTLQRAVVNAASDPLGQLASVGALDTLDGLTLSMRVDRSAAHVHFYDPLKGLVNAVPSRIFAHKPEFLSPQISHQYTEFGGQAGIFLSGAGYAYLIGGGVVGVMVLFCLLGYAGGRIARVSSPGIGLCLTGYFVCRFFIGGDAFDLLYVITMLVGMWIVAGLVVVPRMLSMGLAGRKAEL